MKAPITKAAIAFVVLAACDGAQESPTHPWLPPVSVVTANYLLRIYGDPVQPLQEVQVLADGVVIYSGPLMGRGLYDFYYDDPWHVSGDLGTLPLEAGRHMLSLRVTRQAASPSTYHVSGRIEAVRKVDGITVDSQGASWDESVTLATGDSWTGVFEIRTWRD
jgi:hypothetical protein